MVDNSDKQPELLRKCFFPCKYQKCRLMYIGTKMEKKCVGYMDQIFNLTCKENPLPLNYTMVYGSFLFIKKFNCLYAKHRVLLSSFFHNTPFK